MAKSIFVRFILVSLGCALTLQSGLAMAQTIQTVIGGSAALYASLSTQNSIGQPTAVAVDAQGNLYIADSTHGSVYRVDATSGVLTVVAGNGAADPGALTYPSGLAVDVNGNLFIADSFDDVVYKIPTSGGILQVFAGCGTPNNPACSVYPNLGDGLPASSAFIGTPSSISVDGNGNLYIGDSFDCRVRMVNAITGIISTVAGSTCGYSGDGGPATSAQLGRPGLPVSILGSYSSLPVGVFVDAGGDIFIADSSNYRVREVCASSAGPCGGPGNIQTIVGGNYSGPGPYSGPALGASMIPQAVAVDPTGGLYIADSNSSRISYVNTSTSTVTVAGFSVPPGDYAVIAGPLAAPNLSIANNSILNGPVGIALSNNSSYGNLLYIADQYDFLVQVESLAPTGSQITLYPGVQLYPPPFRSIAAGEYTQEDTVPDIDPMSVRVGGLQAVAEDAASNIYMAESPQRVIKANSHLAGELYRPVYNPRGMFIDNTDHLWIADGNTFVDTVNLVSGFVDFNVLLPDVSLGTFGLTGDSAGMFFADFSYIRTPLSAQPLYGLAPPLTGTYPYSDAELGNNGPAAYATMGTPWGLCTDRTGNLYFTDNKTYVVRAINTGSNPVTIAGVQIASGNVSTIAGGGGNSATIPTVPYGHYYYTASQVGDNGPATSAFMTPVACFVDNLGNIFIADEFNDRIRRVDTTGKISTIVGSQYPGSNGDGGQPTSATLNFPNSIWGDQAGNLLISDSGNHRIREISAILPVPNANISCSDCSLTNAGTSTTSHITLTNSAAGTSVGAAPLIMPAPPSLSDSTYFSIASSNCPIGLPGLPVQQSCTVTVTAKGTVPNGSTQANANLIFHDNAYYSNINSSDGPTPDPANPGQLSGYLQSQPISFEVLPPAANLDPLALIFTAENVPQAITLKNTGSSVLNVTSVSVPAPFALESNPPSPSCSNSGSAFSLQPSRQCSIYVVFSPSSSTATVPSNLVLTIVDNTAAGTGSVPLVGYALVPSGASTFSISSSAPKPVTAAFSLVGVPSGTNITPVCSISPAGLDVACSYSSANQSISASVSIPSCVQTGKADMPAHGSARYLPVAALGIVLLLPWARSSRRRLFSLILFAAASCAMAALGACGSSNSATGACVASVNAGTTFNLSVTATPARAGAIPSLSLTQPDVISVTQ